MSRPSPCGAWIAFGPHVRGVGAALHNDTSRLYMALAQQLGNGCCACEDGAVVLQSRVSSGYLSMPC